MPPAVILKGQRELVKAFNAAGKATRKELRDELRAVAEPVRADAERLAVEAIPTIGPRWYRMRTGVTQKLVYIAPRERGTKGRGDDPRRRPNFADLLIKPMEQALKQDEGKVMAGVEAVLDHIATDWEAI